MKNEENKNMDEQLIISKINKNELDIQEKIKKKIDESNIKLEEYFLINKTWIEKFISLNHKEELFKELIFYVLKKVSFNPKKSIYQNKLKTYEYYNNIKIISKDIVPFLSSIINSENVYNNVSNKIIFIESKIIIIMEKENSLEILNENYIPEYLVYFGENKNITLEKMINIFIKELKLQIPSCINKDNIIFDYVTNSQYSITIINLNIISNKEKVSTNKIKGDNKLFLNKLWEDKYKKKLEKNLVEINNKLNANYQLQLNLSSENFNKRIKMQIEEQNKIFTENYNKSVIKLNNLKEEEDEEKENEKEKEKIIVKKKESNLEQKIFDDYFVILEKNKTFNIMKLEDQEKICSIFSPVLFCLSQITSLNKYLMENQSLIELYRLVEDTLTDIFFDFLKRLKELDEDNIDLSQKSIFRENSNLVFNFLLPKIKDDSNIIINSPGDVLSIILDFFDREQDKYFKYISDEESIIELNKNKKYDRYNEEQMLQKFVDSHSIERKTFIYNKFHFIIKTSRLCKVCHKCSFNYKSFPILKIPLIKSKSIISPNQPDYEIYNALLCKICFPENISQLISPSYSSIKKEFCENCNKYNEIIYDNSIFTLKEYFIINLDREKDPQNEMMFIYPEILDLRKHSKCIINLYQLIGVICKKIDGNDKKTDDLSNENSKFVCYFKIQKSNKWIVFDENYKLSESKNNTKIFDFKGVCVLIYSKIEEE